MPGPTRRIVMLTVFAKTRRQERRQIARAVTAMTLCVAEGHTAEEEGSVTKSWESIRTEKLESMTNQERRRYDQRKAELGRAVRLGLEVKARREAAGLSQRQLADIVGIRQPNIARLEAGDVLPTIGTLDRIADALGLTLDVGFSATSG